MVKTYDIIVEGKVQGVGFRYFVMTRALQLGLKGTVENRLDRNVEIYAQGKDERVKRLLDDIKEGPSLSVVLDVRVETFDQPMFKDFRVL